MDFLCTEAITICDTIPSSFTIFPETVPNFKCRVAGFQFDGSRFIDNACRTSNYEERNDSTLSSTVFSLKLSLSNPKLVRSHEERGWFKQLSYQPTIYIDAVTDR